MLEGKLETNLNSIQRTASTLWVELDTPYFLARVVGRLDTFDRRVIAVDKEWLPALWERIL